MALYWGYRCEWGECVTRGVLMGEDEEQRHECADTGGMRGGCRHE